jgi:hypothetical protein
MADRVENILEKMTDEFQFYKKEDLFSPSEIKQIVKHRRNSEYLLQGKSASLLNFVDAITYEKDLDTKREAKKQG